MILVILDMLSADNKAYIQRQRVIARQPSFLRKYDSAMRYVGAQVPSIRKSLDFYGLKFSTLQLISDWNSWKHILQWGDLLGVWSIKTLTETHGGLGQVVGPWDPNLTFVSWSEEDRNLWRTKTLGDQSSAKKTGRTYFASSKRMPKSFLPGFFDDVFRILPFSVWLFQLLGVTNCPQLPPQKHLETYGK